jgi:hypothetical protein
MASVSRPIRGYQLFSTNEKPIFLVIAFGLAAMCAA